MKTNTLILLLVAASLAVSSAAPPPLALPEAAKLAQTHLSSLNLGEEFYLRSITLQPPREGEGEMTYVAQFTPPISRRIKVGTDPAPVIVRVIRITMDGTVSVVETPLPKAIRPKAVP